VEHSSWVILHFLCTESWTVADDENDGDVSLHRSLYSVSDLDVKQTGL